MKRIAFMCLAHRTLLAATITLLATVSQTHAQCDAEFIKALKTEYREVTSENLGVALYQASCTSRSKSGSKGLELISPKYGNLDYNESNSSATKACYTKDYEFFRRSARDFTLSALPPGAINVLSTCLGGLTLRVTRNGRVLNIRAAYRTQDPADTPAFVEKLNITPDGAVKCAPDEVFPQGMKLTSGGHIIDCEILNPDEDISITLKTSQIPKTVVLKREPTVETVLYKWSAERIPRTWYYNCLNDGKILGVQNYIYPTMRKEGVTNPRLLAGSCLVLNGTGQVTIDGGQPETLRNQWGIKRIKNVLFQCTVDGEVIDNTIHDCRTDNTCKSETSMAYYCAGQYGLNSTIGGPTSH